MTTKDNDPNRRHYFTELKDKDLPGFIQDIYKLGFEVTLWEKGHEDSAENYMLDDVSEEEFCLKLSRKGGLLSKISGSPLIDKELLLVKIPAGKFTYFGTAKLSYDPQANVYTAHMGKRIFQSQQRSNYRLQTNDNIIVQIKWEEKVYSCRDISAGGTSFILSEGEASWFEKEQILEEGTLHFNGKNFHIPKARVAGKFENKDADGNVIDGVKIGIAFVDLPKDTEEALTIHINSEARADEIRKKLAQKKSSS